MWHLKYNFKKYYFNVILILVTAIRVQNPSILGTLIYKNIKLRGVLMRKKKYMIFVVAIVVVALIVSIVANFAGVFGKPKGEDIAKKVDKNNIVQKSNSSKSNKDDKGTKNEVVLKDTASKQDTAKLVDDYLSKVVSDSNDKRIDVSFKQNGKEVEQATVYKDLQASGSNIKYSLRIQNGFLATNRFIEVFLDGDSSGHSINVGQKKLKYSSEKKMFYGVVELNDDNQIKSNIKIK